MSKNGVKSRNLGDFGNRYDCRAGKTPSPRFRAMPGEGPASKKGAPRLPASNSTMGGWDSQSVQIPNTSGGNSPGSLGNNRLPPPPVDFGSKWWRGNVERAPAKNPGAMARAQTCREDLFQTRSICRGCWWALGLAGDSGARFIGFGGNLLEGSRGTA